MQTSDTHSKLLFVKLQNSGFTPAHVAEVGVYLPQTCNVLDFAKDGVRTTLVEANPRIVNIIEDYFSERTNVTLHPVAIYDHACELKLFDRDASTFVGEVGSSPALVNDAYQVQDEDSFTVQAVTFDTLDDGSIDLLSVDIEGCEWFVIKHMRSRPVVISLETHGAKYLNPHLQDILSWMSANGYVPWYKDKSDTVFVLRDRFNVSAVDKLKLAWRNLRLGVRRFRKNLTT